MFINVFLSKLQSSDSMLFKSICSF